MIFQITARIYRAVFLCLFVCANGVATEPVTVAFYNLENYLGMERRIGGEVVEDAPKPEAEVEAVIEGLAAIEPEVLLVCEIGSAPYLADLQKRLESAGISLPHSELVVAASGFDRNLAILSKFPIESRNSESHLTYRIGDDHLPFQRGILDVTVAIGERYRLRCLGLHLKSKREVPEADQALMRLNEARLVRQHVSRILQENPDTNLLLLGDLNALRIEPAVKTVQGAYGRPDYLSLLTLEDSNGAKWTHYWSYADVYSRFDYALFSKSLGPEIDKSDSRIHDWPSWDKASDHRPLVVVVLPEER